MPFANGRQRTERSLSRGQTEEEGDERDNDSDRGSASSFNSSDYSE